MNIQKRHLAYALIALIDMALTLGSYFLASYIYLGDALASEQLVSIRMLSISDSGLIFLIVYAAFLIVGYSAARVFGCIYHGHIRKMVKGVVGVNVVGLILFMTSFYVFNLDDASRVLVFLFFVFSTVSVCFANWVAIHFFRISRNSLKYRRHVLVVGEGHIACEYARAIGTMPSRFEHVIGYITPFATPTKPYPGQDRSYLGECLGNIYGIEAVIQTYQVDEIVLALDVEDYAGVRHVLSAADKYGVALTLVPFYNDIIPRKPNIDSFGGISLVDLRSMPLSNPALAALKRLVDIAVSLIAIIITSWLMAIIAIGVKASSPGPVFFKQERIGMDNKVFKMLKFRSMRENDASDVAWSTNDDPRKTRFGSFIRKYSLDELPQFFNVFVGDMSIVGPRPEIPYHVERFRESIPLYMLRNQVRPGITGLAQISGLRGDTSIDRRIELDLYYIQHWSFWLDVKIFFKTLFGGFVNDEALAEGSFAKRMSQSSAGRAYMAVRESAEDGCLAKVFCVVYLAMMFIYAFFTIYINPDVAAISAISIPSANIVLKYIPIFLLFMGIVIGVCEGRKPVYWIFAALCLLLTYIVYAHSQVFPLIAIFGFVFAYPKSLNIDTSAKVLFAAVAAAILLLVACSLMGSIPDNVSGRGGAERHSMGFVSPNAFAQAVTACLIPYVYFRLKDWRWWDACICLAVGVIVFMVAMGRMSFFMLVILVVAACLCRARRMKDALSNIAPWIGVSCFLLALLMTFLYWQSLDSPFLNGLNSLFSGRFEYIATYYDEYSITIFGQKISTVGMAEVLSDPTKSWRGIDCSYVNILLRFGVVGTLLLLLPSIWLGYEAKREMYTSVIFIMAIIAIFSLTENFYYNPYENFGIYVLGYFISAWATKKAVPQELASAPIVRNIDWVNMKSSRWKDFLDA